jgi:hypothetical protein
VFFCNTLTCCIFSSYHKQTAQDKYGNIALGYSVTGDNTYPGIRATGRSFDAPLGEMNMGETSIVEGGGSQTGGNRWVRERNSMKTFLISIFFWYHSFHSTFVGAFTHIFLAHPQGDYSAMVVDPSDDCTFWYCTQYQDATDSRGWKTKIASFNFGGDCASPENA